MSAIDKWFKEREKYIKLLAKNKKIPSEQRERLAEEFILKQMTLEKLFTQKLSPAKKKT